MKIKIDISIGELLDKISILRIKDERIGDEEKLAHINHELSLLTAIVEEFNEDDMKWAYYFIDELYTVNDKLWDVEDNIRDKERNQEFDDEFIQLARDVYHTNDKRFEVKSRANDHFKSDVVETKSYEEY